MDVFKYLKYKYGFFFVLELMYDIATRAGSASFYIYGEYIIKKIRFKTYYFKKTLIML